LQGWLLWILSLRALRLLVGGPAWLDFFARAAIFTLFSVAIFSLLC
jgi:hypothetical protein